MFKKTVRKIVCAIAFGAGYVFGVAKRVAKGINSFLED